MFFSYALYATALLTLFRGNNGSLVVGISSILLVESQGLLFSLNKFVPLALNASYLDTLATTLCLLTILVVIFVEMAPQAFVRHPLGLSNSLVILALLMVLAFTATSTFFFYIAFEVSLIPISLMILGWGYQPERLAAVMAMMLYTMLASLPLLLILLQASLLGWTEFTLNSSLTLQISSVMTFFCGCALFAFLVKLPMFAVHLWLPKAHVEAPVGGSMFLAALLLKLGGFGLWRVSSFLGSIMFSSLVQSFAILGGVCISFLCLRQTDIKVLIAYSSVAHMSMVAACIILPNFPAMMASFVMLLAHGISSSAMFGAANILYLKFNSRNLLLMGGTLSIVPAFAFFWFLILAANMAAPPTVNLLAEIYVIYYLASSSVLASVVFSLISFLAAAYSLLLYASPLQGQRESLSLRNLSRRPLDFLFLSTHVAYFFTLMCLL